MNNGTFDWQPCVDALTDDRLKELATWRGYSLEFCKWLRAQSYIGLYLGGWAFPVQGTEGNVIGAHYLRGDPAKKDWRYSPGATAEPLIIGDVEAAGETYCFEGQWDAFAFLDRSEAYLKSGVAAIITRGASNSLNAPELAHSQTELYVWPQNDPPKENSEAPSEKWFKQIQSSARVDFYRVSIPRQHKDLNDWARAGATREALQQALESAPPVAAAVANTVQEPPPDWLVLKPVIELSDYLPPQVIFGMLYRGARLAIGGGPKTRKSWLLMQACFCISNRIPFLEIPTSTGPTVYINLELFEGECRQRFVSIANAFAEGDPNKVSVLQARSKGKLLTPALLKQLTLILSEKSIVFTALDPVYKLLAGRDENKAGDVAQVLEPIEAMSEEGKTSVAFSQHYAKGNQGSKYAIDRMAGSNVFSRDADVILTLTELREPDCYVVDIKQRSFPEIPSFGVRWTHPLFVRDPSIDITEIRQAGKDKEAQLEDQPTKSMIAALRATDSLGGLSFSDWLKASGVPKSTFNRRLKTLLHRKIVYQSKIDGNYMFCPSFCRNGDDLQAD